MRSLHRVVHFVAVGMLAAAPAFAQGGMAANADPDKAVAGGGTLPAGWSAKTDRNAPLTNVKFSKMGEGWHFTLGPAVVVYREADKASGNFHAVASFTQTKAAAHPEGAGIVIGGKNLNTDTPTYTYFLVRQDGQFIVKQFAGAAQPVNVTSGWTASDAVAKPDANGKMTNELAIGVSGGKASFTVNGKEVYSTDASKISTDGIVGMRVNHNLDIHVGGFAIHKL
jgi:hypothetical protein